MDREMTKYVMLSNRQLELIKNQADLDTHGFYNMLLLSLNFVFLISSMVLRHIDAGSTFLTTLWGMSFGCQIIVLVLVFVNLGWMINFNRKLTKRAKEFDQELEKI